MRENLRGTERERVVKDTCYVSPLAAHPSIHPHTACPMAQQPLSEQQLDVLKKAGDAHPVLILVITGTISTNLSPAGTGGATA